MSGTVERAEHALLGAVILRPEQLPGLRWIDPVDFATPARGWLWNALHRMGPDRVHPVAITAALADADPGTRQILAPHRVAGMVASCPNAAHAPLYGGMVLEAALHRAVDFVGSDLRTRAAHGQLDEADQLVADAVATGQQLPGMGVRWATVPETVRSLLDTAADRPPTPAPPLVRSRVDAVAEETTVASLLRYPQQMEEVGRWLHAADFADSQHAAVYRAIERLTQRQAPIDALTVTWEAQRGTVPLDPAHLDRLERDSLPGQAEYAGRAVLGAAALDRLDHAGAHVTQLAADTSLSVPALLTASSAAIAPLTATHQRLLALDGPTQNPETAGVPAPRAEMEIDL
ncbi:DnaB-like helicase N-terminal domain-containing protein [Kitasatospora sp. HPMI-4]|uniref:DnaB-like helicase N-terminal domain-containing protein n=1 Tax=Kitasatospora sp. HPMI-4 TaxID=3448443 RepID=UPI003F194CE5